MRQNQRVVGTKVTVVTGASLPPVGGGVDHGVAASLAVVGLAEVLDPGSHVGRTEAVAGRAGWVVLQVQHSREGLAIIGPAATVGEEVLGLAGSGAGGGLRKVVTTSDETGRGCPLVVAGEGLINVAGALSGLVSGLIWGCSLDERGALKQLSSP